MVTATSLSVHIDFAISASLFVFHEYSLDFGDKCHLKIVTRKESDHLDVFKKKREPSQISPWDHIQIFSLMHGKLKDTIFLADKYHFELMALARSWVNL